jgi:NAD(P)-dependent dehydrogenase (short-subunit alcohol dehydrogenase family)
VFAVNVRGLFQVTRACAGLLRAAGGSVVLRGYDLRSPVR